MSILGKAAKLLAIYGVAKVAYTAIKYGNEVQRNEEASENENVRRAVAVNDDRLKTLRKHWSSSAVMTDDYTSKTKEQAVEKEDLLPGELSAVTFKIGNYTVRSAQRVYKILDAGYDPENEPPADEADLVRVKAEIDRIVPSFQDEFRFVHEISARYENGVNDQFTFICRAAEARNCYWSESIEAICTVKENTPDNDASLLVLNTYMGDSFSVDTWYKFDPEGKITTLKLHPYDENIDEARFK